MIASVNLVEFIRTAGKRWSNEKLAARLEEGANILKAVI